VADVLCADGSSISAITLRTNDDLTPVNLPRACASYCAASPKVDYVYNTENKQLLNVDNFPVFGDAKAAGKIDSAVAASELREGKCYIRLDMSTLSCSDIFVLDSKDKDGDAIILNTVSSWGSHCRVFFAPGRQESGATYISDNARFLEVEAEIERNDDGRVTAINTKWDVVLMDSAGINQWLRTAGGVTKSTDLTIKRNATATFDIITSDGSMKKVARDLGMLEAHLTLANDFGMSCDAAGNVLDKTVDGNVTRFRLFDTAEKSAYATRAESMQPWIQGFDSELGVRTDTPQRQVLSTFTPKRSQQTSRYGDHYDRGQLATRDPEEDGLPADALFTKTPEELATMSTQYGMPHIFDHGELSRMATSMFNTVSQIQQYIPDLETGVDRYYRILFLIRYRPADFEEAYGKDALMEMEQELSELANMSGDNLLRMLKRFDINKYSGQQS
jgi:hypothetical protein